MIPIYICDDQPEIAAALTQLIEKQLFVLGFDMGPVIAATDSTAFFASFKKDAIPSIYFLDVDLKEKEDGFRLAEKIREIDPFGFIVFVTNHGDLALETFKYQLQALDFIEKNDPVTMALRIEQCLNKINRLISVKGKNTLYYAAKIFDTIRYIPVEEILFFTAEGRSHRVFLHTTSEVLEFFGSLNAVEKEVGSQFFRCHRNTLVNQNKIDTVDLSKQKIILLDGHSCPLSRSAKKEIVKRNK